MDKIYRVFPIDYDQINRALEDFYKDGYFHQQILNKRYKQYLKTGIPDFGMGKELIPLYITVRLLKPKVVIETGVGYGSSTAYILKALNDNNEGILRSIGVPYLFEDQINAKRALLVDEQLKNRWEYIEGYVWDNQKKMHGDLFLHDSDHCAEYMFWELNQAKKCFKYILVHDASNNPAFTRAFQDWRWDILHFKNQMPINARDGSIGVAYVNRT